MAASYCLCGRVGRPAGRQIASGFVVSRSGTRRCEYGMLHLPSHFSFFREKIIIAIILIIIEVMNAEDMLTSNISCWPAISPADQQYLLLISNISCWPAISPADQKYLLLTINISCWPAISPADQKYILLTSNISCWPAISPADQQYLLQLLSKPVAADQQVTSNGLSFPYSLRFAFYIADLP